MELAPCRYRQATSERELSCALVQQVIGLPLLNPCRVDEAACRACGQLAPPRADRPNAVVSSLIYNRARQLQKELSCPAAIGQAWQAERYALKLLAKEPGGRGSSAFAWTLLVSRIGATCER